MNEWNIQSRAHACQACTKGFTDKELYHTLLLTERSDLQRLDICQSCWNATYGKDITARKGYVSNWQGHYHAPPAAPVEAIQKENAETLLRKLIEANNPKHGPACFILAVMLERKRLLKVKEQLKRDGVRIFIYEQPKTGDLFTITDPNLQLNQLEEVQRDVADLLANGLPQSTPAQNPVPAVTEPAPPPSESLVIDTSVTSVPPIETTLESSAPTPEGVPPSEPAADSSEATPSSSQTSEPVPDSQPESASDSRA